MDLIGRLGHRQALSGTMGSAPSRVILCPFGTRTCERHEKLPRLLGDIPG